ncbi:MAG: DNA polymerase III subunit delta' [Thermodesulfobacteriota bacterium]
MSFKTVLGHERAIKWLQRAILQQRIVHSYLFWGNEGIGKKYVALQFAKALNCQGKHREMADACDVCHSCKKIDQQIHPDVLLIEPEGQTLRVDQVREMQKDLAYRPYEGRRRVVILSAADRMAPQMSNTLLKTLEEPPLSTVFILMANHPRRMLPTILSRCQSIPFHPLPTPLVSKWLMEQKNINKKEAHLLALLSEGSLGKALEILERIEQIPREELLKDWLGSKSLSFKEIEDWIESLPSQRQELLLILEISKTILRDLILTKISKDSSKLIHSDLIEPYRIIASQGSLPSLFHRLESLHHTARALQKNANLRLALEAMMLSWTEG